MLTKTEARVPDALHYCRAICAQNTYYTVLKEMENDPSKRAEYIQAIEDEFKRNKRKLKEYNKPYGLRGYKTKRQPNLSTSQLSTIKMAAMYVSSSYSATFAQDLTILALFGEITSYMCPKNAKPVAIMGFAFLL